MQDFESYDVVSIIGSGSFGTCYKVKHKTTLKEFVWKAVNYGEMSEDKKQLLVSEVNVLSKLQHPNIIRYYDHIIHKKSSTLYIIMEYCCGGDLSKTIKYCIENKYSLNETFIWRVLYQTASALNVCHSQCTATVLHRDIKPANVFLDAEQNVKLGDFGLAKVLVEKENYAHTFVGTPLYMSPELIKNKKYNKKSDIWALGCLIYEICALKPPFVGDDFNNLSSKIENGVFQRIPEIYSDDLEKMIVFMLSTDSECRPTVDVVLRHPTVILNSSKTIHSLYNTPNHNSKKCAQNLFPEKIQVRLENIRNRETAVKIREEKLNEKERGLNKREKRIAVLERLANEKLARANLYLKHSKEMKTRPKQLIEQLDTSCSADPGDTSILPTSAKICEEQLSKPFNFVRSRSERKVHFHKQNIFQSQCNDVVLKEYNFFKRENEENVIKNKAKTPFCKNIFKNLNKVSQSSCSLGSKSSESGSDVSKTITRPLSWTEENKKCAFSLLKLMNSECEKENIHSKITHTKM